MRPTPLSAVIRPFHGRKWLQLIPRPAQRHRTVFAVDFARWIEHFGRELSELRPLDVPAWRVQLAQPATAGPGPPMDRDHLTNGMRSNRDRGLN